LVKVGHSVTLIVGKPQEAYQHQRADFLKSLGVKLIYLPDVKGRLPEKIKALLTLSKVLLRNKFDILHFESIYLTFIPKVLHKRFVLTYHSFGLQKNFYSQHATRLISISEGITEDAMKRHGYRKEEIDVVLHGVSERFAQLYTEDEQTTIRKSLGIPVNKTIIGIVASIEPRKGHHFLIEAVSKLPKEMRETLHMVFCGNYKGADSKEWLQETIQKFALSDKVTILGFQDPLKVYKALDIFCLPSIWEGFPLTAIEAMMASCCVIRSNVQGCKEQIIEGVTGYSFESENPDDLARVLREVLLNPQLKTAASKKAREYALSKFSLTTMARNTIEVYKRAMK